MGWGTRARDILFLNDDEGFLCTDNKVYKTSNGGRTWFDIPSIYSGEASKIKFYDGKLGYLYGGYDSYALYKTTDGGESWNRIEPENYAGPLNGVAATAEKLFATHQSYYSDDRSRSLVVSSDDGQTWSVLDYYRNDQIRQRVFTSGKDAIAVGEYGALVTKNAGQTWQQATIGLLDIDRVYIADESTMIFLKDGELYKSSDAGVTVKKVLTTDQGVTYGSAGPIYGFEDDVMFSVGWSDLYRSLDKGETWTLVETPPGYHIQEIQFLTATTGYRLELFGSVDKTIDGGLTWIRIESEALPQVTTFDAMFFVNENTGYVGGDYLRKTTDGGTTWKKIDWPLTDIIKVGFVDEDHGYVVTGGGQVMETKDGGLTWSSIFSSGYGRLYSAQFVDNRIYLFGEDGLLAGTSDSPAPGKPGYINGPSEVCVGDVVQFNIVSGGAQTHWSTTGINVEDQGGYFVVGFREIGEYFVSARHVNSCGSSEIRTRTVNVSGPLTKPVIEGPGQVMAGDLDIEYAVINQDAATEYIWQVTGSSNVDIDGSKVLVDWPANAGQGKIAVLAVSQSGCRADGSLDIQLQLPVAVESELEDQISLYPNPAKDDVNIHSSHNRPMLVRIVDMMGREHARLELAGNHNHTLSIRQLVGGLYMVEFTDGIQTVSKKLIKK